MSVFQRLFVATTLLCFVALCAGCASSDAPACEGNDDCGTGEICDTSEGVCMEVSVDPCEDDDECPADHTCDDGVCVEDEDPDQCSEDSDCEDHELCDGGDCIDNPDLVCTFNDDCDDGVCIDGLCIEEPDDYCSIDDDCGVGEICVVDTCVDDDSNDNQPNLDNPTVESVDPGDEDTGVSVDTEIRISFDMDMNPTQSTHPSNIQVVAQSTDTTVDATYEYLSDEREIVITPDAPLLPGTEYMVDIIGPQSMEGRPAEPQRTSFITEWDIDADVEALADRYAPVIYQAVEDPDAPDAEGNIPTTIDFDGDLDASNNLANAQSGNFDMPATVYYSYTATESHHFLHYVLYYPFRTDNNGHHDHDLLSVLVVVERDSEAVVLVDTADADDDRHAYKPDRDDKPEVISGDEDPTELDPEQFEDDERFLLYIPDGEHTPCHWYERDTGGIIFGPCTGDPETFRTGEGFVLRPGSAQTFEDADEDADGFDEIQYGLKPFIDPFWTRLGDLSSNLFSGTRNSYDVDSARPAGPRGQTLNLARRLANDSGSTEDFGLLPYRWLPTKSAEPDEPDNAGAWFLDPAWRMGAWYSFGDDYSQSYCHNFYFQIDRSGDPECQD